MTGPPNEKGRPGRDGLGPKLGSARSRFSYTKRGAPATRKALELARHAAEQHGISFDAGGDE